MNNDLFSRFIALSFQGEATPLLSGTKKFQSSKLQRSRKNIPDKNRKAVKDLVIFPGPKRSWLLQMIKLLFHDSILPASFYILLTMFCLSRQVQIFMSYVTFTTLQYVCGWKIRQKPRLAYQIIVFPYGLDLFDKARDLVMTPARIVRPYKEFLANSQKNFKEY